MPKGPKDANVMADNTDPDQTAPFSTVCFDQTIPILRNFYTIIFVQSPL